MDEPLRMRFGHHKGKRFDDIPEKYLVYLISDLRFLMTATELAYIQTILEPPMPEKKKPEFERTFYDDWGTEGWYIDLELWEQHFGHRQSSRTTAPPSRKPEPPKPSVDYESIIRSWARQIAFENHPDRGGDPKAFNAVMEAADSLKRLLGIK